MFTEIEVVGSLMDRPIPPGTKIGNGRATVDHAAAAKRRGFADWEVRDLDHAREIAAIIAAGELHRLPPSWRKDRATQEEGTMNRALLAVAAAASVACHNVASSDGPISPIVTYDPRAALIVAAMSNWTEVTIPAGTYTAVAWGEADAVFAAVGGRGRGELAGRRDVDLAHNHGHLLRGHLRQRDLRRGGRLRGLHVDRRRDVDEPYHPRGSLPRCRLGRD